MSSTFSKIYPKFRGQMPPRLLRAPMMRFVVPLDGNKRR